MKTILSSAALIVLAACTPSANDQLPDSAGDASLVGMIKRGEARACSADAVKQTVIAALLPEYEPEGDLIQDDIDVGLGKIDLGLATISLAAKDESVGSVTCDANVTIKVPGSSRVEQAISYTVRPSAEDEESFIIQGDYGSAGSRIARLASLLVSRAMQDRLEADRAATIETDVVEEEPEEAEVPRDQTLVGNDYLEKPSVNAM